MTRQARGKVRRFVQARLAPEDVATRAALRQGDCDRCGECCKILFRCPFLIESAQGEHSCRIYHRRFLSCRHFPVDPRDLAEVCKCSYSFGQDSLAVKDDSTAEPQPAAL
jgi:hypothetical protein